MKKGTTIVDIAKAINVTASTVSRALHNHPSISIETKNLVLKTAKKLEYHPNSFATSLRKGRGNTIGLVVPQINRTFFSNVIHGVEDIAHQYGYNVLICQSQEKFDQEKEVIKTLINSRVDGIIISVSRETQSERHIKSAIERGIPVVQFDRTIKALDSHQVLNDNFTGAYEVIAHLAGQGYRRIAHFGGPQYINIYKDRFLGYSKGLADFNLPVDEDLIIYDALSQQVSHDAILKMFSENNKPDAIFAVSDYAALGVLIALQEMNIKVPEEAGIVGFANEPFTSIVSPALSTVEQFSEDMGRSAAHMLLEQVSTEEQNVFVSQNQTIKPRLIVRESSNRMKMNFSP